MVCTGVSCCCTDDLSLSHRKLYVAEDVSAVVKEVSLPSLYPVSIEWEPQFSVLTHLVGKGDHQAGMDVSHQITLHGLWQPGIAATRRPSIVEAVVGALGNGNQKPQTFVDIGAGYGFFSLAAAARGHNVVAFELSPHSIEAFEASIAYNGFTRSIKVKKIAIGGRQEHICVARMSATQDSIVAVEALHRGYGSVEVCSKDKNGSNLYLSFPVGTKRIMLYFLQ